MDSKPLLRILFAAGIVIAALGMFAASKTPSAELRWDSFASIGIIAVGVFVAFIGIMGVLDPTPAPTEEAQRSRTAVPVRYFPVVFGGFIAAVAVVAALVVGHFIGRNEGYITFIFVFVLANIAFGLGLALVKAPSYG